MKKRIIELLFSKILKNNATDCGSDDGSDDLEIKLPRISSYNQRIKLLEQTEADAKKLIQEYEERLKLVSQKAKELEEALEATQRYYNQREKEKAAEEQRKLRSIQDQTLALAKSASQDLEKLSGDLENLVSLGDPELDEI